MPDSCGQYNPEGCTKSCQQCYEGVIAGVKEYACYGQCVVVDAYGRRHLGPGEGAPAGWTPSAGGSMAEMIENEIANINNSGPIPTSQLDCCTLGNCQNSSCWTNGVECRCSVNKPGGAGTWKPASKPTVNVDRLTQTTVEEQKAALAAARLNFNKRGGINSTPIIPSKYTTVKTLAATWECTYGVKGCSPVTDCGGQCYWLNHPRSDPGNTPPATGAICKCAPVGAPPPATEDDGTVIRETEQVLKVALAKARRAANFDRTMQAAKDCCNGGPCDKTKNQCYYNTDGNRACVCHPLKAGEVTMPPPPYADGWRPFVPPPPTAQFQTPPAPLNCCKSDRCDDNRGFYCYIHTKTGVCQCIHYTTPPTDPDLKPYKSNITPTPMY